MKITQTLTKLWSEVEAQQPQPAAQVTLPGWGGRRQGSAGPGLWPPKQAGSGGLRLLSLKRTWKQVCVQGVLVASVLGAVGWEPGTVGQGWRFEGPTVGPL